jgi:2'-5' RNA ligase
MRRIEGTKLATEPFEVREFHLLKSQLTPGGPIYDSVRTVRFGGA